MLIKYASNPESPICLHILGQNLVNAVHEEARQLLCILTTVEILLKQDKIQQALDVIKIIEIQHHENT